MAKRPDAILHPNQAAKEAADLLLEAGFLPLRRYKGGESRYLKPMWSAMKIRIGDHVQLGSIDIGAQIVIVGPTARREIPDAVNIALAQFLERARGSPPNRLRASVLGYRAVRKELGI